MKHSHDWVRLGAAQILGLLLKSLDVKQVSHVVSRPSAAAQVGFLLDKQARKQLMSLCQDFCDQLVPGHEIMEELLKQVNFLHTLSYVILSITVIFIG